MSVRKVGRFKICRIANASRPQTAITSTSQIIVWPTPLNSTKLLIHREVKVNTHSCTLQRHYNGRTSHRYHLDKLYWYVSHWE